MIIDPYRHGSDVVLLLNFNDSLVCEASGETFTLVNAAAIETGMFTKCLNVNGSAGGGGTHRCYNDTVRSQWQLNDGGDFQLECFVQMNDVPSTSGSTLIKFGPDPNVNNVNFFMRVTSVTAGTELRFIGNAPLGGGFSTSVTVDIPYDTDVHHVAWIGVGGEQWIAVDGVVGSVLADPYDNEVATTHVIRIGGGALAQSDAVPAKIDSIRLSRRATYDMSAGNFTPPAGPLGMSL